VLKVAQLVKSVHVFMYSCPARLIDSPHMSFSALFQCHATFPCSIHCIHAYIMFKLLLCFHQHAVTCIYGLSNRLITFTAILTHLARGKGVNLTSLFLPCFCGSPHYFAGGQPNYYAKYAFAYLVHFNNWLTI